MCVVFFSGSSSFPQKAGNTQAKAKPTINPASRYVSRPRDSSRTTTTGNVNSRTPSVPSGADYEKKLPLKRTLPPSFSTTPVPPRSSTNSVVQGNAGRFGVDYSSNLAVSNRSAFGDRHRGAHSEIGIHRGMNGVRILPPSMTTHGISPSSPLHYGGPSDPIHRVGVGEDRNSENDERLIYQAALQVTLSSLMLWS